jgi:predicted RNA-binding protein associated with RNAse of E/G family
VAAGAQEAEHRAMIVWLVVPGQGPFGSRRSRPGRPASLGSSAVALHPPKVETFVVDEGTNTDPKGFVRTVDLYREAPFGLYLSRAMPGHPSLDHMRSWLLPELGIRVTDFRFQPGREREQDYYVDIADVRRDGPVWTTVDHYLDLVVHTGERTELLDVDEYVEAVAAGLLAPDAAERALTTAVSVHVGVAEHGHDLDAWLATRGVVLDWPWR